MRSLEILVWVTEIILIVADSGNAAVNKSINSAHEHALFL